MAKCHPIPPKITAHQALVNPPRRTSRPSAPYCVLPPSLHLQVVTVAKVAAVMREALERGALRPVAQVVPSAVATPMTTARGVMNALPAPVLALAVLTQTAPNAMRAARCVTMVSVVVAFHSAMDSHASVLVVRNAHNPTALMQIALVLSVANAHLNKANAALPVHVLKAAALVALTVIEPLAGMVSVCLACAEHVKKGVRQVLSVLAVMSVLDRAQRAREASGVMVAAKEVAISAAGVMLPKAAPSNVVPARIFVAREANVMHAAVIALRSVMQTTAGVIFLVPLFPSRSVVRPRAFAPTALLPMVRTVRFLSSGLNLSSIRMTVPARFASTSALPIWDCARAAKPTNGWSAAGCVSMVKWP